MVHIEIAQHDADYTLNAKGNFCFDRLIEGWRDTPLVDYRLKR